ncbi:MAG: STAS domain-containing protein [Desulfobacteraceae bacterium]|nr:STAS domain-containing protein [Desulfobacteraceae bacterium]
MNQNLDGTKLRSNKDRSITDQRIHDYTGEQSIILQLQGFIFFGTANSLYEKVKIMVATDDKTIQFIIIDMKLVQSMDSSAIKSFEKLLYHLDKKTITLFLVNLSSEVSTLFKTNKFTHKHHSPLNIFPSLDEALELCEDKMILDEKQRIQQSHITGKNSENKLFQAAYHDMIAALDVQILFETVVDNIRQYLEKLTVNEKDFLYNQGDESSDLFFIESGQIALIKIESDGRKSRVRTLGPWSITGELGSFLGYHSSYDAMIVKKGIVYKLSAAQRVKLETQNPLLTTDLHKLVIQMLGNQLLKTSRMTDT